LHKDWIGAPAARPATAGPSSRRAALVSASASASAEPRLPPRLAFIRFLLDNVVWLILIVAVVGFSIGIEGFMSPQNYINIVYHSVFIGILAISQTYCLIAGHMDLSIESTAAFTAILSAWLAGSSRYASGLQVDPYITLLVVIGFGCLVGLVNGFLVARLRINAFLVTLSTYIIVRGLALSLTEGKGVTELPPSFRLADTIQLGGIPLMVYLMVAFYVLFFFILTRTRFGRHVFVLGGNATAAQNFGINVPGMVFRVFVLSGAIAAVTGWLITARSAGATPNAATGFLFEVLGAVVIGGVSLNGGVGSLVGVFAGVLLFSAIHSALNILAISPFVADVVRGGLVLVAIVLDAVKRMVAPHFLTNRDS
jgi:ribose transport system permease protein